MVTGNEEYLTRLQTAGKCTDIWWKLERQLPGRRSARKRWVDHFTGVLVDKRGFARCTSAPQFFLSAERHVGVEVHMDDVHGFGPVRFPDGGIHHDGSEYDHLKRIRKNVDGVTTIESNRKYLDAVLELLGLEGAKDVPTRSVPAHQEQLVTRDLLGPAEIAVYRQCVGGLLYYTQDRADAQFEMSILGSMLWKPTARYLKGTRDVVNKRQLDQDVDKHVVKLDGFSDSDWAGSTDRKSQSSGAVFIDGAPF